MKKHNLDLISKKYSEQELEEKINLFNQHAWWCIYLYQNLSEEFIEKYSDKVYWSLICKYQNLSEKFIEKYQDKVYWPYISNFQKLSEKFIKKHINQIDISCLMANEKISYKIKEEIENLKEII